MQVLLNCLVDLDFFSFNTMSALESLGIFFFFKRMASPLPEEERRCLIDSIFFFCKFSEGRCRRAASSSGTELSKLSFTVFSYNKHWSELIFEKILEEVRRRAASSTARILKSQLLSLLYKKCSSKLTFEKFLEEEASQQTSSSSFQNSQKSALQ